MDAVFSWIVLLLSGISKSVRTVDAVTAGSHIGGIESIGQVTKKIQRDKQTLCFVSKMHANGDGSEAPMICKKILRISAMRYVNDTAEPKPNPIFRKKMYNPPHFRIEDLREMQRFIAAHPLATLFSHTAYGPDAAHLPLLWQDDGSANGILYGHFAKANPMWRSARPQSRADVELSKRARARHIAPDRHAGGNTGNPLPLNRTTRKQPNPPLAHE